MRPEVDFRFQGVPLQEPQQEKEGSSKQDFGKMCMAIMLRSHKDALIAELQNNTPNAAFQGGIKTHDSYLGKCRKL